jgi:AcrR family transcriptional regulator
MTQLADHSQINLRLKRTRILLREALIALIEERGFDALTIGELTERAMVSRAAFYRNYQDKYDLVEQIFEEAMSTLFEAIGELGQDHPAGVWIRFFEHIAQYDRLYRALLGKKGSPWFVRKMRLRLAELIKERGREFSHGPITSAHAAHLEHLTHPFSDTFVPDLVAAMFVEAITWWLEQERPYTPKEMATRTALLAAAVFREASIWTELSSL